jgi:uncharacterized protein YaiI (UPF0178 family)
MSSEERNFARWCQISCRHLVYRILRPSVKKPKRELIYVDSEQDEVDFYIYQCAKAGNLVITQDMGLAGLLVKKGVYVLSPRGTFVTDEHMDTILYNRYVSAKLRRQGTFTKGPKAFSQQDRQCFLSSLEKILSNYRGIL